MTSGGHSTTTTLQNVCHLITDGKHGDCEPEENSGYYFLSAKDVRDGKLVYENSRQITKEDFLQTHRRTQLQPLDILIVSTGATIGRMAMAPDNEFISRTTFQKSVAILKPNKDLVSPHWLYYKLYQAKDLLVNMSGGTAQGNLLLRDLRAFEIDIPSLPTQRRIADILSAYDDLIENNTRRILILEQMAQTIYQEWFGKVESKANSLPKGWQLVKISDIANLHRGRSYGSDNLVEDGGLPFLNLKCLARDGGFRPDGLKWYKGIFKETQTAKAGDIVMGLTDMTQERRIVARAARVPQMGIDLFVMSMDLLKISPQPNIHNTYLYAMLRFSGFADEVKQHANGANVLHLSPDQIEQYQFALPPELSRNKFGKIVEPLYMQCDVLEKKNANLRQTRDLLLPRLVNGEIDVSSLS